MLFIHSGNVSDLKSYLKQNLCYRSWNAITCERAYGDVKMYLHVFLLKKKIITVDFKEQLSFCLCSSVTANNDIAV